MTQIQATRRPIPRLATVFACGMLALAMLGCGGESNAIASAQSRNTRPSHDKPFNAVATTAMIADIISNVAGDQAQIKTLMGPGIDPHLYRPTRDDVAALLNADVVFYNGLNLEGKMSDTFIKIANAGKPVFAVTELVDQAYLLSSDDEGHDDPHVWMDPNGWIKATEAVVMKLCEFDSANTEKYERNGRAYVEELKKLDAYAKKALATIPAERRVLITAHDAFNYFARAYGLEVRGIQGISTDSEAGLRQIEELVSLIVARKISAVFTESSVSDKNVRALVEGAKSRGQNVAIGGELFSDAMGSPGSYEGTYIGMMDHNVTTIVRALGGEAPQHGLHGKLRQ